LEEFDDFSMTTVICHDFLNSQVWKIPLLSRMCGHPEQNKKKTALLKWFSISKPFFTWCKKGYQAKTVIKKPH